MLKKTSSRSAPPIVKTGNRDLGLRRVFADYRRLPLLPVPGYIAPDKPKTGTAG